MTIAEASLLILALAVVAWIALSILTPKRITSYGLWLILFEEWLDFLRAERRARRARWAAIKARRCEELRTQHIEKPVEIEWTEREA